MVYIRQKQLAGLHPYKYAGVDHSLVSRYILKPFYTNVAIKCFPMSMAPNAVSPRRFCRTCHAPNLQG
ncbi:Phosphotransferase [Xanthoria parietina]